MRAGTQALSMLSAPLNVQVLEALAEGPQSLMDLRRTVGSPPPTTMRGHLKALSEVGVLTSQRQRPFPGSVEYKLSESGHDLHRLSKVLQRWLDRAPQPRPQMGSAAAKSVLKAFVEGWSSTSIRALAARPLTLTELDRLISGLNYPSLERRLAAMRHTGLIEAYPREGRGTPYTVTPWLRQAVAPLAAAALWEHEHLGDVSACLSRIDIEATFLLAMPLTRLPDELSGRCRLAVELGTSVNEPAGVLVGIQKGRIESCVCRLRGNADASSSGSTGAWLRAVVLNLTDHLEIHGEWVLAATVVESLHRALYGIRAPVRA